MAINCRGQFARLHLSPKTPAIMRSFLRFFVSCRRMLHSPGVVMANTRRTVLAGIRFCRKTLVFTFVRRP